MKPLARWTMGKVVETGWEVLSESLRLFPKVYPEFDLIICHNNLTFQEQKRLASFGIPLYTQQSSECGFPFDNYPSKDARGFAWKLVPPRLRPEAHELWIDNDIVIRERIFEVDLWLCMDVPIISRGCSRDYGRFSDKVTAKETFCAGFFGLPPHFDFLGKILQYCKGQPLVNYDEQGLVSLIASENDDFLLATVELVGSWVGINEIKRLPPNAHFCRVNEDVGLVSWKHYKTITLPH